ncbi:Txe/YoeB family addiction module toxin [Parapedobacter composti]|nr:Txe/YoeB family addiction module toxin [Parapedobacter composti]
MGKPEPLKYELSGKWSRRISDEHRIVYEVFEGRIRVHSLRGHYR